MNIGKMSELNLYQKYRVAIIGNTAFSLLNFRGPLISTMVRHGTTVFAFAPDYDEQSRTMMRELGATPVDFSMSRTGMNPLRDFLDLVRLTSQLRELQVNSSLCYFIKPVIYGTLAASLANVPRRIAMIEGAGYVFTEGGRFGLRRRVLRKFVTQLYRLALSQTQRVFMLNQDDRQLFIELNMVDPKKVYLLSGIGVELDQFVVQQTSPDIPCFILIARLLKEKGIYDYIEAARIVRSHRPDARFLLLGSIDLNPGAIAQEEVQAWVDEGLVEWPGHVDDVKPYIAEASVFVLPSYREGLPRSTQEVMAMGKPVITTDAPGCRDTVEEGINGFKVPVRDPGALANAMLKLIASPELVTRMGQASRRKAEETYDVHKINAEIMKIMSIEETLLEDPALAMKHSGYYEETPASR